MLAYSLSLKESNSQITSEITQILARQVQKKLKKIRAVVEANAKRLLGVHLLLSDEYGSLTSPDGILRIHLGLEDGPRAANGIIEAVQESMQAVVLPQAGSFMGGLNIGIYRLGFVDALASKEAEYISRGRRYGAITIKWLEWLLFRGTEQITVAEIKIGNWRNSRTHKAIMVTRDFDSNSLAGRYNQRKGRVQKGWGMPSEFAGTEDDNWLMRSGRKAAPQILQMMSQEFNK